MSVLQFTPHVPAVSILAAIKRELAKVPMGASQRARTYHSKSYRDVDVSGISAHAPDGTERWSLSIVGGMKPCIELAMWHNIQTASLAFSPYELAAIDRANAHLDGLIVSGLKRYDRDHALALTNALDDRHDLVIQSELEELAS